MNTNLFKYRNFGIFPLSVYVGLLLLQRASLTREAAAAGLFPHMISCAAVWNGPRVYKAQPVSSKETMELDEELNYLCLECDPCPPLAHKPLRVWFLLKGWWQPDTTPDEGGVDWGWCPPLTAVLE